MTKEEIRKIAESIDEDNVIDGTYITPIRISSLIAYEYIFKWISPFLHLEEEVNVYIPIWYFGKLILGYSIIRDKVVQCMPLHIKNVHIKLYESEDGGKADYIYINGKENYICIVEYIPES